MKKVLIVFVVVMLSVMASVAMAGQQQTVTVTLEAIRVMDLTAATAGATVNNTTMPTTPGLDLATLEFTGGALKWTVNAPSKVVASQHADGFTYTGLAGGVDVDTLPLTVGYDVQAKVAIDGATAIKTMDQSYDNGSSSLEYSVNPTVATPLGIYEYTVDFTIIDNS